MDVFKKERGKSRLKECPHKLFLFKWIQRMGWGQVRRSHMENMHNINMHKEFFPRTGSSLQLMGQTGSLGERLQHFAISFFSPYFKWRVRQMCFLCMTAWRWIQSVKFAVQIAFLMKSGTKQGHGYGRAGRRENPRRGGYSATARHFVAQEAVRSHLCSTGPKCGLLIQRAIRGHQDEHWDRPL